MQATETKTVRKRRRNEKQNVSKQEQQINKTMNKEFQISIISATARQAGK